MKPVVPQNILSTKITVTGTATALFTLMDAAGSINTSENYYTGEGADTLVISAEGGSVRLGIGGLIPTATVGELVSQGQKVVIPTLDLAQVKLIAVSGTPACSVMLAIGTTNTELNGFPIPSTGGGAATDVNIANFGGASVALGQTTAAASMPVVLASNAALPAGTNAIGKLSANSGVDIGDVDVTSVVPGVTATSLGKAEDAAHTSGDTGVMSLGVGNEAQSSFAADGDYIPHAVDVKGNALVVGNLAHDAVDAGFPLKIGGQARTTNPTAVADADRTNAIFDKLGKQVVVGSIRDLKGTQKTTITSSVSETTIVTAVDSTFLDLYGLIIANTSASACNVTIKDATAGTTRFIFAVPAGETRGFMVPESAAHNQASVNNNWTATCSGSVASIEITAMYVKNI